MSEATEESKSQYEDESVTQTTVETTEITENEEDKGEDLNEQHAPEEQSSILEDIQEEAKEEETQDEGSAEKVQEAAEEEAAPAADEVAVILFDQIPAKDSKKYLELKKFIWRSIFWVNVMGDLIERHNATKQVGDICNFNICFFDSRSKVKKQKM